MSYSSKRSVSILCSPTLLLTCLLPTGHRGRVLVLWRSAERGHRWWLPRPHRFQSWFSQNSSWLCLPSRTRDVRTHVVALVLVDLNTPCRIVLQGQELLTSNMMVMPMGVWKRVIPIWSLPLNWFVGRCQCRLVFSCCPLLIALQSSLATSSEVCSLVPSSSNVKSHLFPQIRVPTLLLDSAVVSDPPYITYIRSAAV